MNVFALVDSSNDDAYRHRIAAFSWALHERNLHLETASLDRPIPWKTLRAAEVVLLQNRLLPWWQLRLIRLAAKRLLFDIDELPTDTGGSIWNAFRRTVRSADRTIVGTPYLRRKACFHVAENRVEMIPTCVEPGMFSAASHRRYHEGAKLTWLSPSRPAGSIEPTYPLLRAIGRRLPQVRLQLVGDRLPMSIPQMRIAHWPWSETTEASDLADADIGISWLPNAPSSLGQGRLTLLRYMAAGLPVVANPIGENRRMIVDGENGFLASTPREWADAVERLAADPQLRRRMGAAGRTLVEQHYQAQMWAGRFAQVVETTIHGQRISEETFSTQTALEPTAEMDFDAVYQEEPLDPTWHGSTAHQATEKMGAGTSRSSL